MICTMLLMVMTILVPGCSGGLLEEMDRPAADPDLSAPTVTGFREELSLSVAWGEDPCCDETLLERAVSSAEPRFVTVYRGAGARYTDSNLASEVVYLYRLRKRKGNRLFGPSPTAMGVGSAAIEDECEPNNRKENATPLLFERGGNLYFYQDRTGLVVSDVDWYAVTVPPRHRLRVIVDQIRPDVPGAENTDLYYQLEGEMRVGFQNRNPIEIVNYAMEERVLRFSLAPIPAECFVDPTLEGGKMIQYLVTLAGSELL